MVERSPGQLDAIFQALADPTRRAMLRHLLQGERTVTHLAAPFQMSLAAASKHIRVLEQACLIRRTVHGRTHHCRLDPGPLAEIRRWIAEYEQFWTERLVALDQLLTEGETPCK